MTIPGKTYLTWDNSKPRKVSICPKVYGPGSPRTTYLGFHHQHPQFPNFPNITDVCSLYGAVAQVTYTFATCPIKLSFSPPRFPSPGPPSRTLPSWPPSRRWSDSARNISTSFTHLSWNYWPQIWVMRDGILALPEALPLSWLLLLRLADSHLKKRRLLQFGLQTNAGSLCMAFLTFSLPWT